MLLHIPDILSADEVARLRQALAGADWTDGRETVGAQGAQVKRNLQLPDAAPLKHELGQAVLNALARNPLYFAAALPLRTIPPRFNRYEGGGEYGFHVDGAVMTQAASATQPALTLRTDLSCTLFLSAPEEYDGGELVISDTYGEHEVKLPAGDLILYPSSSLHRVLPVTRGARLASFFWVQSLVRDAGRRQSLFELDTAIQALTATKADAAALLRLSNVYHNLLRDWSET
ncbi:Fe2+-dependent dioxygenase [Xanthomonas graminis]|uniref:PKHD-type hydroxylase PD_1553 n=1 Tax=Xanthomonas graminis pv. phlei TaxID=487906 RepID=A0A0K2ZY26_9XANT|nr:Fe2+-dependent dioxygenase [Xanthomonas translucens]UKE66891.1 Fe2+-dependent dioxygenase [Xanthomonas translucens pv. phlei]UKE72113.1 Fe2+-dependent dioxygenase [Xanthomonas translucens pv. phleipratensis]CTP90711.1 PKHD-type hydroxylase PD_1553 [Xanthomonas translucens pv. phlei]